MKQLETINTKEKQKDISKGQKIVAAVYLVTKHLSDREPLKTELRDRAVKFVCSLGEESKSYLEQLETLLGGAVLAGLISEKNTSIIVYESKLFYQNNNSFEEGVLVEVFGQKDTFVIKKDSLKSANPVSFKNYQKDAVSTNINNFKTDRKDKILSFINDRKSAVIKDITTLFPEVSEKTIQRELNTLIETGKITKRGNKRWSIYMAVNSLL
jgi:hypothetical protein